MGQIKVGVAVIIKNAYGEILVGKRLGKHGYGTWCPPGGHLEFGETIEEAARREVFEETGMTVIKTKQLTAISDVTTENEGTQYITLWLEAEVKFLTPRNIEPDKCAGWEWHHIHQVPKPHFLAFSNFINDLVKNAYWGDDIIRVPIVGGSLKVGDYVFASRWSDADPNDPWWVGHIRMITATEIMIVGSARSWGRAMKITGEQGQRILTEYAKLEGGSHTNIDVAKAFGAFQ